MGCAQNDSVNLCHIRNCDIVLKWRGLSPLRDVIDSFTLISAFSAEKYMCEYFRWCLALLDSISYILGGITVVTDEKGVLHKHRMSGFADLEKGVFDLSQYGW